MRVEQGGHSIPKAVIRRRFKAGRLNFNNVYKSLVDSWILYDNSGNQPKVMDQGSVS